MANKNCQQIKVTLIFEFPKLLRKFVILLKQRKYFYFIFISIFFFVYNVTESIYVYAIKALKYLQRNKYGKLNKNYRNIPIIEMK